MLATINVTPGVGSFTDAKGNTYSIDHAGNAIENGKLIPGGGGTGKMVFMNNGVYGQDAKTGSWYVWNGSVWAVAPMPTLYVAPCVGSFTDAKGNIYSVNPAGAAMENGKVIVGGGGTGAMAFVNNIVYGQDAKTGSWYTWNGSTWTPSAAPPLSGNFVTSAPTPVPPPAPVIVAPKPVTNTTSTTTPTPVTNTTTTVVTPKPTPTPVPAPVATPVATASATGQFKVSGGKILDPKGNVFIPRGIACYDYQLNQVCTNAAGAPLLTMFPGMNTLRLACYGYQAPSAYEPMVSQLTALGIVVLIENHQTTSGSNAGGGQGTTMTGAALTAETNWYAAVATHFINNPYVWFGTNNEPPNTSNTANAYEQGACTTQQVATYAAIRGTGNKSLIFMEQIGGGVPYGGTGSFNQTGNPPNDPGLMGANNVQGLYPDSAYASMTNIGFDLHCYNWTSGYATSVSQCATSLQYMVGLCQQITSADGLVPVVICEYGISTDGANVDIGGTQNCQAVQQSGLGCIAWTWADGGADTLTDGHGNYTSYGQQIAGYLATFK